MKFLHHDINHEININSLRTKHNMISLTNDKDIQINQANYVFVISRNCEDCKYIFFIKTNVSINTVI